MAQFCVHPGCFAPAIGAARSRKHCRAHYRSDVLAGVQMVRCTVLAGDGSRGEVGAVVDALTGEDVTHGGVVNLDPQETNILALVQGGIVAVIPDAAAEALKAAKD